MIDECDFDHLNQFVWTLVARPKIGGYANRSIWNHGKTSKVSMQREVWARHNGPIPPGITIDHDNRIGLDNRLCNLRAATIHQQGYNKGVPSHSKTGYKGVHWYECAHGFKSMIKFKGRRIYVGLFVTAEKAAHAYNHAATMLHGEFACLNPLPPNSVAIADQREIESIVGARCAKFLSEGNV
jgi:hypothetical protein